MPNTREKLIELLEELFVDYGATAIFFTSGEAEVLADHLIANGVTIQQWIPVTERLPEYGQQVIVYLGNLLSKQVMAYHFWSKDFDIWANVTHWMPLPEPPKEVE